MYPFFVFDVDRNASDEEVSTRYHELVETYPPDRCPVAFTVVRAAYEAIRDRRGRLRTWFFYFDRFGRAFEEAGSFRSPPAARPRATASMVSAALRAARREDEA